MEQNDRSEENYSSQVNVLELQQGPPPPPRKCPRCDSLNTKFCYYNNYSHAQPRYLCKACRRYWTHGGSLRNVPFGGSCRRNKRSRNVMSEVVAPSSNTISTTQSQYYQGIVQTLPTSNSSSGEKFGANVALLQGLNVAALNHQSMINPPPMPLSSWTQIGSRFFDGFGHVTPNTSTQSSYSFWNIGNNAAQIDSSFNPNP